MKLPPELVLIGGWIVQTVVARQRALAPPFFQRHFMLAMS
jgi:hypothetical protein